MKHTMGKRFFAWILTALLLLGTAPAASAQQSDTRYCPKCRGTIYGIHVDKSCIHCGYTWWECSGCGFTDYWDDTSDNSPLGHSYDHSNICTRCGDDNNPPNQRAGADTSQHQCGQGGQHQYRLMGYVYPQQWNNGTKKWVCQKCQAVCLEKFPLLAMGPDAVQDNTSWLILPGTDPATTPDRPSNSTGPSTSTDPTNPTTPTNPTNPTTPNDPNDSTTPGDPSDPSRPVCTHPTWKSPKTTPATCTEEGKITRTCSVCGTEEVVRTLPVASHKWKTDVQKPTCAQEGKRTQTCTVCGREEVVSVLPRVAHTWEKRTEAATTTAPGRTWQICKVCGAEETLSTTQQKVHTGSGSTSLAKLSQEEIRQLLQDNPLDLPENIYDTKPSTSAPYSTGKVKDTALQAAVNRLNALRRIAGIPAVTLDAALCQNAQYGAVVMAANNQLSHSPGRPAGMDQAFYKLGYDACGSSNIYMGRILTYAVDGFMDDSDGSNVSRLGHRRWQLNPVMGKIGFGCAGNYCAEKVFDTSGAGCDFDYISWPASGNFPSDLFNRNQAWSVALNSDVYASPGGVSVTLSGGGRSWSFQGKGYTASSSGKYFNVNTQNYGGLPCIIFRPDGVEDYSGTYTVSIGGLRYKNGGAASLEFTVDFFSLGNQQSGSTTPNQNQQNSQNNQNQQNNQNNQNNQNQQNNQNNQTGQNRRNPFTDVPSNTYYTDAVLWALDAGVTTGTTATTFEPNTTCTRGQVVTFLWRAKGRPEPKIRTNPFQDVKSSSPYFKAILWAYENGITTGTSKTRFSPNSTCTNGHVVTFLWRAEGEPAASGSSALASSFARDWYTDAVAWADSSGLLNNTGAAFTPGSQSPRANIVTYLYRNLAE